MAQVGWTSSAFAALKLLQWHYHANRTFKEVYNKLPIEIWGDRHYKLNMFYFRRFTRGIFDGLRVNYVHQLKTCALQCWFNCLTNKNITTFNCSICSDSCRKQRLLYVNNFINYNFINYWWQLLYKSVMMNKWLFEFMSSIIRWFRIEILNTNRCLIRARDPWMAHYILTTDSLTEL